MESGRYSLDNLNPEQRVWKEYPWMFLEEEKKKKKKKKKGKKKRKHKRSKKEMKLRLIEKTTNTAVDTAADILRMYFRKKFSSS